MLTNLLSEVSDFLKTALDKIFIGLLYGVGAAFGIHIAQFLLIHVIGSGITLPL